MLTNYDRTLLLTLLLAERQKVLEHHASIDLGSWAKTEIGIINDLITKLELRTRDYEETI